MIISVYNCEYGLLFMRVEPLGRKQKFLSPLHAFPYQIELMRSLEDEDDHYRKILKEKLHTIDSAGLIHVYRKELGDKLLVS